MPINSQEKGKRAERDLARWFKVNGYPDAERAVKTGTTQTHDAGDLILEHNEFRLCVEIKHHAGGLSDLQVASFGAKLGQQCVQSKSSLGILVERRDRVSDPGRWWVHVHAFHFARLEMAPPLVYFSDRPVIEPGNIFRPVRVSVGYFAELLRRTGLAHSGEGVATSAVSGHVASGTEAERPQAVGGS
jgi:hypothetical protein